MNALLIARKELLSSFSSPLAWFVTAGFLFTTGALFAGIVLQSPEATMRYALQNFHVVFLFVTPLLTMRLLAEEQSSGTIDLLLSSPVRAWELVLGKFLGVLGLFTVMTAFTLYYPFLLFIFGRPDVGPMVTGYIGFLLYAGSFLAIGLFTSSVTRNQIVAASLAFAIVLIIYLATLVGDAIRNPIGDFFNYMAAPKHLEDFARGVVDTRDVVYFVSVAFVALFLTVRVVETKRSV
jgi:ABC-2 type transport system permease protein